MTQIFLSYAHEDVEDARKIYQILTEKNLSVWMDEKELLPGHHWALAIARAITDCDIFIACLSNKSVSKQGYVQKELRMAYDVLDTLPEGKVYIIPVRLDDCEVPSRLKAFQWLDFFAPDGKEKLIRAIIAHTKIPTISKESASFGPSFDIPMPKRKKTFTQFEKDRFLKEAFDYMKQYFQQALQQLEKSNDDIQTNFNDISNIEFTSKIYIHGNVVRQCQIWLGDGSFMQDSICYNESRQLSGERNSLSDYLPVQAIEDELRLRIGDLAIMLSIPVEDRFATKEKAAEYLWRRLTYRLE